MVTFIVIECYLFFNHRWKEKNQKWHIYCEAFHGMFVVVAFKHFLNNNRDLIY